MTYVIAQPCVDVKDKTCVKECPVDCIYEGPRMLYIQPDECIECGACEPVCPVQAIFFIADVPEQWAPFTAANAEFFADLGAPGGAAKLGKLDRDHPLVAGLPPQPTGSAGPRAESAAERPPGPPVRPVSRRPDARRR